MLRISGILALVMILLQLTLPEACAENMPVAEPALEAYAASPGSDSRKAMPVVFPQAGLARPAVQPYPTGRPQRPPQPEAKDTLMVSKMSGEVHLKHLQGEKLSPSRSLAIETGKDASWCEFKLAQATGRVWKESQVCVSPDAACVYLNKGVLILQLRRGAGGKITLIAGDFSCRLQQAATLRVQKFEDGRVLVQVLEAAAGLQVYNRKTGELQEVETSTVLRSF